MLTIITLPTNFIATTTAFIGALWADLMPLIALVIGLPLAFWAIRCIINLARAR